MHPDNHSKWPALHFAEEDEKTQGHLPSPMSNILPCSAISYIQVIFISFLHVCQLCDTASVVSGDTVEYVVCSFLDAGKLVCVVAHYLFAGCYYWMEHSRTERPVQPLYTVQEWQYVVSNLPCFWEILISIEKASFFDFRISPLSVDKENYLGIIRNSFISIKSRWKINKPLSPKQNWLNWNLREFYQIPQTIWRQKHCFSPAVKGVSLEYLIQLLYRTETF